MNRPSGFFNRLEDSTEVGRFTSRCHGDKSNSWMPPARWKAIVRDLYWKACRTTDAVNQQQTTAESTMFENRVKKCLAEGRPALGSAVPDASEFVAKLTVDCGVDFLWIDLEHRPFGTHEVRWLPIICRQAGCVPMVRVPGLDPIWVKKALDIGANAIMVPQVNSADEAKRAVEYAKYPPEGSRGITPLWTVQMDVSWDDYLPAANEETCVIVQVETPAGIENLDEIAAVEGVDIVFAGPADLSASMGVIGQPQHPKVQAFLEAFPERVAAHNKPAGITFNSMAECQLAFDRGFRFINVGTLVHFGIDGLKAGLAELRARG